MKNQTLITTGVIALIVVVNLASGQTRYPLQDTATESSPAATAASPTAPQRETPASRTVTHRYPLFSGPSGLDAPPPSITESPIPPPSVYPLRSAEFAPNSPLATPSARYDLGDPAQRNLTPPRPEASTPSRPTHRTPATAPRNSQVFLGPVYSPHLVNHYVEQLLTNRAVLRPYPPSQGHPHSFAYSYPTPDTPGPFYYHGRMQTPSPTHFLAPHSNTFWFGEFGAILIQRTKDNP